MVEHGTGGGLVPAPERNEPIRGIVSFTDKAEVPMKNRMLKTVVAVVATMSLVAPPAIAAVGAGTAGAATISPVGRYNATIVGVGHSFPSPLTIRMHGQFGFKGGPQGTWTESKHVISMVGTLAGATWVFVIRRFGNNLGSVTNEGTVTMNGKRFGKWLAVRK
jgi:hypothetical protein